MRHRGDPRRFVRALDPQTLAWADFTANRQYVSIGNTRINERVALLFMDYPARQRLKILGHMSTVEAADRPDLADRLRVDGYHSRIEHLVQVTIAAYDWNCPQHITPRFTAEEVAAAIAPLHAQIADLQARLAAALERPAEGSPKGRQPLPNP